MTRSIEHRTTLQWPAAQVYAALINERYLHERLIAVGGKDADVIAYTKEGDVVEYRLRHGIVDADLPAAVRSMLKGDLVIERTESWRPNPAAGYQGTVLASVPGMPEKIEGTMRLADNEHGSVLSMNGEVKVSIPFLGGTIEALVAEQVGKLLAMESEFTVEWLSGTAR